MASFTILESWLLFAYNVVRGSTPYNDFDGNEPDWMMVYPTVNLSKYPTPQTSLNWGAEGVGEELIPTLAWEGVREGIDDAKYIYTLTRYIEKAKSSQDSKIVKEGVDPRTTL